MHFFPTSVTSGEIYLRVVMGITALAQVALGVLVVLKVASCCHAIAAGEKDRKKALNKNLYKSIMANEKTFTKLGNLGSV